MIKKHWTPIYILNRIKNFYFEKTNPNLPWINPKAIFLFNELLRKKDVGIEFGSGSSTVWFSNRVEHLTSIEDNEVWYDKVKKQFIKEKINNVDYLFLSTNDDNPLEGEYCRFLKTVKNESIDFIVVDGKYRDILSLQAIPKIKKGGFIYLDDSQRYIPRKTKSPYSIHKNLADNSKNWKEFINKTKYWRKIWTTDGVSDATFFIKTE